MASKVYIVNLPMKFNLEQGSYLPAKDFSPAAQYGEFVYLTPHGRGPDNPALLLPAMAKVLKDFRAEDYLLPAGPPPLIAWAAAMAARNANGRLKLLIWPSERAPDAGQYRVAEVDLFANPVQFF